MSVDLVLPENLDVNALAKIFDEAYIETKIDEDGDLVIREDYKIFAFIPESRERITFRAYFGITDSFDMPAKLKQVNKVNAELGVIRCYINENVPGTLIFDTNLPIKGGVTKRAVVFSLKTFAAVLNIALEELDEGFVE